MTDHKIQYIFSLIKDLNRLLLESRLMYFELSLFSSFQNVIPVATMLLYAIVTELFHTAYSILICTWFLKLVIRSVEYPMRRISLFITIYCICN